MFLLRLLKYLLIGLLVRYLYLGWRKVTRPGPDQTRVKDEIKSKKQPPSPLTDQDISDADFEEIP